MKIRWFILALLLFLPSSFLKTQNNKSNEDEIVRFDKKVHDFGDLLLSDGPQSCTFTLTNISNSPIVIHNVVSSCGCTTPVWSKAPVQKGGKAEITVTYSNDQGPFPFNKTITVYVSDVNRPVVLRIRGDVHEKSLALDQVYSVKIGHLGLKRDNLTLGYILQGDSKYDDVLVANLSDSPIKVETASASDGLTLSFSPNPIPAKSTAKMKFTVNTAKGAKQWGKTLYKATLKIDGKQQKGGIAVEAAINDNFDNYTKAMLLKAPMPYLEKTYYEFGNVPAGKVIESSFTIKNSGKSDLVIHKIESDRTDTVISVRTPLTIKPGESAAVKFSLGTTGLDGEILNVLNLITNSPTKPNVNFFISGIVLK